MSSLIEEKELKPIEKLTITNLENTQLTILKIREIILKSNYSFISFQNDFVFLYFNIYQIKSYFSRISSKSNI